MTSISSVHIFSPCAKLFSFFLSPEQVSAAVTPSSSSVNRAKGMHTPLTSFPINKWQERESLLRKIKRIEDFHLFTYLFILSGWIDLFYFPIHPLLLPAQLLLSAPSRTHLSARAVAAAIFGGAEKRQSQRRHRLRRQRKHFSFFKAGGGWIVKSNDDAHVDHKPGFRLDCLSWP